MSTEDGALRTAGGPERRGRPGQRYVGSRSALGVRACPPEQPSLTFLRKTPGGLCSVSTHLRSSGGGPNLNARGAAEECVGRGMAGRGRAPDPGSRALRLLGSGLGTVGSPATTPNSATFTVMGNSDLVTGVAVLATWVSGQEMLAQHREDGSRQKRDPSPSPGWPAPTHRPPCAPGVTEPGGLPLTTPTEVKGPPRSHDGGDDVELASLVHEDQRGVRRAPSSQVKPEA